MFELEQLIDTSVGRLQSARLQSSAPIEIESGACN
jgi:hypothetical protein